MRYFAFLLLSLSVLIGILSCNNEDGFVSDPNYQLSFSVDTLSFDTLFTGFASTTQLFKIYNTANRKVRIDEIHLQSNDSDYRINLNGIQADAFADIEIEANDSLFVFVELDLPDKDQDLAREVKDALLFQMNGKQQGVILQAWAQDVIKINSNITDSQNWSANRPYLVQNPIVIESSGSLTLNEGTKVYFSKGAGIDVQGQFHVLGSFDDPVLLSSSRLEELYKNVPGQWTGIHYSAGFGKSILQNFCLKNAIFGLNCEGNESVKDSLEISYAILKNFNQKGLTFSNCHVFAHDLLLYNCGAECLEVGVESSLQLYQSSLYNSWFYSIRSAGILSVKDSNPEKITIGNSIIWGSRPDELELNGISNISVGNCLLKLGDSRQNEWNSAFTSCIFNQNPMFLDDQENDFHLSEESPCRDTGSPAIGNLFPFDLSGDSRVSDTEPDLGVYEFKIEAQ